GVVTALESGSSGALALARRREGKVVIRHLICFSGHAQRSPQPSHLFSIVRHYREKEKRHMCFISFSPAHTHAHRMRKPYVESTTSS
ncbi:unnamed protein product, partial [Ixodes hexagonus]